VKLRRVSRATAAAIAVACLLTAGCIPYAYPKLSCVYGIELGPEASDVHVFRVDALATSPLIGFTCCEYSLSEITPKADATVPFSMRVTVERGAIPLLNPFKLIPCSTHDTRVRLYRPGYQLAELNSWMRWTGLIGSLHATGANKYERLPASSLRPS
jgi:hypothetical protein